MPATEILLAELRKLRDAGRLRTVEGIWITHYHDDHTDYISDVSREFNSPVYFTDRMSEVMGNPGGFRLPCLTTKGVPTSGAKRDGEKLDWHEWKFTFWHFPGQTLYHGGLVAEREDRQTYLFTGDSFTPSGMDDYCMQNRVILRQGEGYEFCLRRIASLPPNTWLLNQHVEPMFRYTGAQVKRMQAELSERSAALAQLSPWPDINYMVDESWARVFPYGSQISAGETVELQLRITNHAPSRMSLQGRMEPSGRSGTDSGGRGACDRAEEGWRAAGPCPRSWPRAACGHRRLVFRRPPAKAVDGGADSRPLKVDRMHAGRSSFLGAIEDDGSLSSLSIEPDFQLLSVDFTGKRLCLIAKDCVERKRTLGNFPLSDRRGLPVARDRAFQLCVSCFQIKYNLHPVSCGSVPFA